MCDLYSYEILISKMWFFVVFYEYFGKMHSATTKFLDDTFLDYCSIWIYLKMFWNYTTHIYLILFQYLILVLYVIFFGLLLLINQKRNL